MSAERAPDETGVRLSFYELRLLLGAAKSYGNRRRKYAAKRQPPPGGQNLNLVEADTVDGASAKLAAAMEAKWPGRDERERRARLAKGDDRRALESAP